MKQILLSILALFSSVASFAQPTEGVLAEEYVDMFDSIFVNDELDEKMLEINDAVNYFVNSFTTRHVILPHAGTLPFILSLTPESVLGSMVTMTVSGPMNGADICAIHALMGKDTRYPNIKVLDLSRAWIITDSVTYNAFSSDMDHEYFANLKGERKILPAKEVFGNIEGLENVQGGFEMLRDKWGYAVEVEKDKIYISLSATVEDNITREMFANLPYIETLILPITTKFVAQDATSNSPNLREVVRHDKPFPTHKAGDDVPRVGFTVHAKVHQSKYPERLSDFTWTGEIAKVMAENGEFTVSCTAPQHALIALHNLSNVFIAEEGAHYELDLTKRTFTGSPLTDRLHSYMKPMEKILWDINETKNDLCHELNTDSIKALKERIFKMQNQFETMFVTACKENEDNTIPANLLEIYYEQMNPALVQAMLALMNNRNAFDNSTRFPWGFLRERSRIDDIDWHEFADTTRMVRINVSKPGTLRSMKTDDEWKTIHRLYLTGSINGSDVMWLRELSRNNSQRPAPLIALDMEEAELDSLPVSAFSFTSLSYIRLPNMLKEISSSAFYDSRIAYINMPEGLRRINEKAFSNCDVLRHVVIPDSVTYLGAGAFSQCRKLRTIRLSEHLDTIGHTPFSRCLNLQRLHIPASVRHIASNRFPECPSLTVTVDPANENYEAFEDVILGKSDSAKHTLGQGVQRYIPKKATDRQVFKEFPAKFRATYKMVNGKPVLIKRVPIE